MPRRKISSARWLKRHISDPYVIQAKQQGYRSRAAFKLIELDDRFHFLKPGRHVVDLGAAPGSWSQVAVQRVCPTQSNARVIALDLKPIHPIPGTITLIADVLHPQTPPRLIEALNGQADVLLSDMSISTTGHPLTDHLRIMGLAHAAFDLACTILAPDGIFLCKIFQGGAKADLLEPLKRRFAAVRHVKPASSRKQSREMYFLATGFR